MKLTPLELFESSAVASSSRSSQTLSSSSSTARSMDLSERFIRIVPADFPVDLKLQFDNVVGCFSEDGLPALA